MGFMSKENLLENVNMIQKADKPVAIVLGGTLPNREFLTQLKSRGYHTILIDNRNNSPAKSVADEHVLESTLDKETVYKIARDRNVSLITSGFVEHAYISATYALEKLGMYVPFSYETAIKVNDKGYVKKMMLENGIPTSQYIQTDNYEDVIKKDFRYPVIIKPASGHSSNGVKKTMDLELLETYFNDALAISRNGQVIVEEFVTGTEISAYCFIRNKKAKLLMTAERLSTFDGEDQVIKCYATVAPARISKTAERKAAEIATEIARVFHLDNVPLFFQGIVHGDDVSVIEFSPRLGGGSCFVTIKENTGFDVVSAAIDSWEGKEASLEAWHDPECLYAVNTVYGKDGVFDHVTGGQELINEGTVETILTIRTKGEKLDNSRASSSRVCYFITKSKEENELLHKAKRAFEVLNVIGNDNESLIKRHINLCEMQKS